MKFLGIFCCIVLLSCEVRIIFLACRSLRFLAFCYESATFCQDLLLLILIGLVLALFERVHLEHDRVLTSDLSSEIQSLEGGSSNFIFTSGLSGWRLRIFEVRI